MIIWSPSRIASVLDVLRGSDSRATALALEAISNDAPGDVQVLQEVERALSNDAPVLLSIPFVIGEVRLRAAEALVAERRRHGVAEPVVVAMHRSMKANDIGLAFEASGLVRPKVLPQPQAMVEVYRLLRDAGLVRQFTFHGDPTPSAA